MLFLQVSRGKEGESAPFAGNKSGLMLKSSDMPDFPIDYKQEHRIYFAFELKILWSLQ